MTKEKLLVSFSGGRTSAFMTKRLIDEYKDSCEIVVVFANTGQEDERTLEFVHKCDKEFDFNTVWVEALVNQEPKKGTKHKVTSFQTAARSGEPFEDVVRKYGIPNKISPHCTREMKQRPITSFARSLGWKPKDYQTAIGIRVDEIDRMNSRAKEAGIIYPLVQWGIKKQDVLDWWSNQSFDLMIPEHRGNCLWCWKKSNRKLYTLAKEEPSLFDFPDYLERTYGLVGATAKRNNRPMQFFRGDKSTKELLVESKEVNFSTFVDQRFLDMNNGCEDSCEVFASEEDVEELLSERE